MKKPNSKSVKKQKQKQKIQIKVKDKLVTIGWLDRTNKVAELDFSKDERTNFREGCWIIYRDFVDFLVREDMDILIKDASTKWKFKISAAEFKYNAKKHSTFLMCSLRHFEVLKASKWTTVLNCDDTTCSFNVASHCLKGTINITKKGVCSWL